MKQKRITKNIKKWLTVIVFSGITAFVLGFYVKNIVKTQAKAETENYVVLSNAEEGKTIDGGEQAGNGIGSVADDSTLNILTESKDKYWTTARYVYDSSGNYLEYTHIGGYENNQGLQAPLGINYSTDTFSEFRFNLPSHNYYIAFDYFLKLNEYNESGARVTRANIKYCLNTATTGGPYVLTELTNGLKVVNPNKIANSNYKQGSSVYPILIGNEWEYGYKTLPYEYTTDGSISWKRFELVTDNFNDIKTLIFNFTMDGTFGIRNLTLKTKDEFLRENYAMLTISDIERLKTDTEILGIKNIFELPDASYTFKINFEKVRYGEAVCLFFSNSHLGENVYVRLFNGEHTPSIELRYVKFTQGTPKGKSLVSANYDLSDGEHYVQVYFNKTDYVIGIRIDKVLELTTSLEEPYRNAFEISTMKMTSNSTEPLDESAYGDFTLEEYDNYLHGEPEEPEQDEPTTDTEPQVEEQKNWFSRTWESITNWFTTNFVLIITFASLLILVGVLIIIIVKRG